MQGFKEKTWQQCKGISNFSLSNELSLRGPKGAVAIPKGFRVFLYEVFPKIRGIATPVCALVRNDIKTINPNWNCKGVKKERPRMTRGRWGYSLLNSFWEQYLMMALRVTIPMKLPKSSTTGTKF